jgi:hypothetical protein
MLAIGKQAQTREWRAGYCPQPLNAPEKENADAAHDHFPDAKRRQFQIP